jgi:alkanesulfonate monooxygenase SsuD/methylene tetrahydromethanopterin reductase-like flavin-dependent oxidoreductase (luciferase family)
MRVHVVNVMRPEPGASTRDRFIAFAREVEARGFAGLWVTDAFGRGRPTLDPVGLMNIIAAVTDRVEIGTCVLQVPVRHPVELAHRIAGLHAMTGDRLKLGLGSGSTKADFDLVGADYDARFKTLMNSLDTMRRAWRGEKLTPEGTALAPWPGTEGGPALLLGAWRNKRWIVYAAEECQGWIASGLYPRPEELEAGMKFYRDVGGRRAVLANVIVDLHGNGGDMPLGGRASVMLTGGEAAARAKLQWIRDVGFDDVLCMTRPENLDDLSRLRDAL